MVAWAAQGVHGAVYRAVPQRAARAAPVALKLALHPEDPRFAREAQLLSRLRHPSVPRLRGSGTWQAPDGTRYPWLAMEWVDGVPLYHWGSHPDLPSRECFRVLAQLARALAAVHALGAVHRDLKGENVLVRRCDGRALLTDFGLGTFPGAELLTPPAACLGTPLYRSPEAGLFVLHRRRDGSARYAHQPADDLYALGMTACRLLTGEYPEWVEPTQDEHGTWQVHSVRTPASLRGVDPTVRACILRLLAVRPEQRGTAGEFAAALEHASRPPAPAREPARLGGSWLAMAASLTLVAWASWVASVQPVQKTFVVQVMPATEGTQDAGTAGLGESASTASTAQTQEPSVQAPLAQDSPPEPQPGQIRPNAKGRCPHKRQVALNGACWVPSEMDREQCEALGPIGTLFQGRCYVPALSRDRPSTSHPTRPP
ncbi:serine/threonine-protein kinase [Hyalangium gracile]|uniref:serine/threonine-protein kinase n=1 Tax=Hyalangium gracile TaxID=394092 RepID=UPI001CCB8EE0|nr:serine/threonine-protein kinase [Hyalangium gracile]